MKIFIFFEFSKERVIFYYVIKLFQAPRGLSSILKIVET